MQLTAEERKALKALGVHGTAKCDYCKKLIKTALHYNGSAGETYCTNACFELGEKTTRSRVERQYPQKEDTMIDKKKTKAPEAEAEEPKKKKKVAAPEPEPDEPKKKKKVATPAEEDEDPAPKKKKKAAPAPAEEDEDDDADAGDEDDDEDAKPAKKKKSKPAEDEDDAPPAKKSGKKSKADAEDDAPPAKSAKTAKPKKVAGSKKDKPGENPFREGTMCHKAFERLLTGKSRSLDALFKGYEVGDKRRMISNMAKRGIERGGFTIVRNSDDTYQLGK